MDLPASPHSSAAARKTKIRLYLVSLSIFCGGCASLFSDPPKKAAYSAYIPARIALLRARPWPARGRYHDQPLSNLSQEALSATLKALDSYVAQAFSDQPYMRGLSPALVEKLLAKEGLGAESLDFGPLWAYEAAACPNCNEALKVYEQVRNQAKWRDWLKTLGEKAGKSDAVLIPLLDYLSEGLVDDRGLNYFELKAGIILILIDSDSGALIWQGARQFKVRKRQLSANPKAQPASPPLEELHQGLFQSDLWDRFPGRLSPKA